MLRHPPVLKYNGISVVLQNPSRFDLNQLISGTVSYSFEQALKPASRYACDIRVLDDKSSFLPDTRVVLLCGERCLASIGLYDKNLDNVRGGCYLRDGIVYIPTYFPQDTHDIKNYEATLNTQYGTGEQEEETDSEGEEGDSKDRGRTARKNYRFWFAQDIRKAVEISKQGYKPNSCSYRIQPNTDEFIHWCSLQRGRFIYFDIETEPTTQQITCFAVSNSASEVFCINLINYKWQNVYDVSTTAKLLKAVAGLFQHNTLVIHNALFDLFVMMWKYKIPPPPIDKIHCTMSMFHRLHCEVEKSLGHVISIATHEIYHKDEGHFNPTNSLQETKLLQYNAKDVERLAQIHTWLLAEGARKGALSSMDQVNMSIRPYLTMMMRGLALDNDLLCKHIDNLNKRITFFESRVLPKLCGFPLNPRSPQQVAGYLYDMLHLEKPKGKNISLTGKRQMYKIALQHDIPSVKVILALRRWSRERGQLGFQHWQRDGVVTCAYLPTGTKPFRLASRALMSRSAMPGGIPAFKGYGTNLQNWNKDRIRHLIVPFDRKNNVFLQCDQKGADAFIVSCIAPAGRLRQLFQHGIKPHTYVAAHLFHKHWKELGHDCINMVLVAEIPQIKQIPGWKELEAAIKKTDDDIPSKRFYYMAKQTCHSANYDVGAQEFIMNTMDKSEGEVVIPYASGVRFLGTYHEIFPEVKQWNGLVRDQLKKDRTLRNLFGYPRFFNGSLQDNNVIKDAYSWVPASTVACITHLAFIDLQKKIDNGELVGVAVEQNNHDSLLVECPRDRVDEVKPIVLAAMQREFTTEKGETFKMGADIGVGLNWKDIK